MRVQNITDMIGNTPLLKIDDNIEYYAKIEGSNLFGSVKDRAARYLMENAYNDGIIHNPMAIISANILRHMPRKSFIKIRRIVLIFNLHLL